MPTTPNRGYRTGQDSEVDPIDALNDFAADVDADVAAIVVGGVPGGGVPQGDVSVVTVPANSVAWTPTDVYFNGEDALWLEASGAISHNGTTPVYGPYYSGGAYLVWVLVTDGSTPDGDVAAQNDFRGCCTAYRKTGRLWLRIRDVGGAGDNPGSFAVKVHRFTDLGAALSPLSEVGTLRDAVAALTIRVAALEVA